MRRGILALLFWYGVILALLFFGLLYYNVYRLVVSCLANSKGEL